MILTLSGMTKLYPDIWETFTLPDPIPVEQCINTILNVCGDTELRYPNHDYLKFYIGLWCQNHREQIAKMYGTTVLDYNPIHNYNMVENGSDTYKGIDSEIETGSIDRKHYNTDTQTQQIGQKQRRTGSMQTTTQTEKLSGQLVEEVTHNVSSYSSNNLLPHSSDKTVRSEVPTMKDTVTETPIGEGIEIQVMPTDGQDVLIRDGKESIDYNDHKKAYEYGKSIEHELTRSGNIGVTTTQKMLKDERELLEFNVYYWIAGMFENDFCITVY